MIVGIFTYVHICRHTTDQDEVCVCVCVCVCVRQKMSLNTREEEEGLVAPRKKFLASPT